MSVKDRISAQLDLLSRSELEEVETYVAYIKFKTRVRPRRIPAKDELAVLYGDAADDDLDLAEAGMDNYGDGLADEDSK